MIDLPPLRARQAVAAPTVLRLDGAAEVLGVSKRTVRRLVASGQLGASRVGRLLLIDVREVDALLARTRVGGQQERLARPPRM